jgi:hypothetical protein
MMLVFFGLAVAVGWRLRDKWRERKHLQARLVLEQVLLMRQGRDNAEQLARMATMERLLAEERAKKWSSSRVMESLEAHAEMPEKPRLDYGRVQLEEADLPRPRRRRG